MTLVVRVGQCKVVLLVETCAEHILPRVARDGFILAHCAVVEIDFSAVVFRTPVGRTVGDTLHLFSVAVGVGDEAFVVVRRVAALRSVTRTVFGLIFRHVSHEVTRQAHVEVNAEALLAFTRLGGDEHHTVGTFRTVLCGSGSTFQNRDVLDVLGVDVGQRVRPTALHGPIVTGIHFLVVHGNSVEDNEWLVGLCDGRKTTHVDGDGTRGAARSSLDLHTRRLTVEGCTDRRRTRLGQFCRTHLADGITHLTGVFLDTESSHDDFVQAVDFFFQNDVEVSITRSSGDGLRCETDVTHFQLAVGRTLDEKLTVHVRDGSHLGSNGFHRSADDGFSVLINYGTFHSNVLRIDSHAKEHEKHRPKSSA